MKHIFPNRNTKLKEKMLSTDKAEHKGYKHAPNV